MRGLPRLQLFRALFPSWRFFDRPGDPYILEACWNPDAHQTERRWERVYEPVRFDAWNLLLNPHGNWVMAWQSLVERLAMELEEAGEDFPAGSVSYELVSHGVALLAHGRPHQFRLVCGGEVLLLSPLLESQVRP